MHLHVNVTDPAVAGQVEQLLRFYVSGLAEAADEVVIEVAPERDSLGTALHCCRVVAKRGGGRLEFEERQADLTVATTRALDRCVRTLRRHQAQRSSLSA